MPPEVEQAIRDARAEGKGMLKIARELGVGTATVQRVLRYGTVKNTVKNKAYRYGWRDQLTQAKAELDRRSLVEVTRYVTEVRWRQARLARVAIVKALKGKLVQQGLAVLDGLQDAQPRHPCGSADD